MKKLFYFTAFLCLLFAMTRPAHAQVDPVIVEVKRHEAHPALRGFSELALGTLFGTAAAGIPIITGVFVNPFKLRGPLIAAALLYPAGVASGVVLGGHVTQSYSNYWAPFVGAYAGAVVADLTAYFLAEDYPYLSAALVLALPVITSVVAAEVSHARRKHDAYYPLMISFPF